MATNLVPIYLDNERVGLSGDPKPRVAKILVSGGKTETQPVVRLKSPSDLKGQRLRANDVIDRAVEKDAVYLKCEGSPPASGAGSTQTGGGFAVPLGEKPEPKVDPSFNPEPKGPQPPPMKPEPPLQTPPSQP